MTNEIAISTESITIKPRPNGEATAGCSIKLGPKASQILKFRALRRLAREIRDRTAYPAAKPTRKEITLVVTSSILPDQQQGCSVCYLLPYNFICLNPTGRYAGTLGSCSHTPAASPQEIACAVTHITASLKPSLYKPMFDFSLCRCGAGQFQTGRQGAAHISAGWAGPTSI